MEVQYIGLRGSTVQPYIAGWGWDGPLGPALVFVFGPFYVTVWATLGCFRRVEADEP